MKILYHHRTASKDGQTVHIEELIAALRHQGHEVVVVAPALAQNTAFGHDGGLVARIKRRLPGAVYELLELLYAVHAYRRLKRAWATHRPDVLYERYNLFCPAGLWLKRSTGIPFLLEVNAPLAQERTLHGGLRLRRLARWSERVVWRGADMTLPVTRVLADHLRREGVPEARIRVIPNGIDRDRFSAEAVANADGDGDGNAGGLRASLGLTGKVVLGFTGFIRAWHGLPHVVDAMAALPNREDVHLLVIGDGPARLDLEAHAKRRGMTTQVTCTGLIDRTRIAAHVATFDIALQPRVVDYASPLKLFEYMALGRAILAPDQPNIREVLSHDTTALLFRIDDNKDFVRQLTRLCGDAALRDQLGTAASRAIEERGYTWDANARLVVGLATRLRSEGSGRPEGNARPGHQRPPRHRAIGARRHGRDPIPLDHQAG